MAKDLSVGHRWLCFGRGGLLADGVGDTMVRAFLMVMNAILTTQVIEMPLAEHNEMVKAFLLDLLNESFDERIRIRRPECRDFYVFGS